MNKNIVDKYYWCIEHPNIGLKYTQGTIELTPHMVDPRDGHIKEDNELNTKLEWWIEFSKLAADGDGIQTHYWELDCGGDSAEDAVLALYNLMLTLYGDY